MDLGSFLNSLVTQVESLFGSKGRFVAPGGGSPSLAFKNPITSPGSYQAPIHDSWASSGGFSYRPNSTHPTGHMGVDMRCSGGTPVYSFAPGVVTNVGTDPKGGNVVNIKHPDNVTSYYAHLATVKVQKGDKVDTNTVIGRAGQSGNASHTFPHLHFQVWKDGQITDPARFFAVPQYTALSPAEKQRPWVSPQAQQEAAAFNMKEHVATRRVAFSKDVDKLLVLSHQYYKLTRRG